MRPHPGLKRVLRHMDLTRALGKSSACALALAMAAFAAAWGSPAYGQAQSFPSRQVTLIYPFTAAAGSTQLKVVTDKLAERWRQPIIIDFRPGAYTVPGMTAMLRAPAD